MTAWDVVVAGGGPAGAVCAIELARHGRRVLLLEASTSPRHEVGESLSPSACAVLESVGVTFADRHFVPKAGASFAWGDQGAFSTTYAGAAAWQVRRADLDAVLLTLAENAGVSVRTGCRVERVRFDGDQAVGVRLAGGSGAETDVDARWVVDATGRQALLARQLGLSADDDGIPAHTVWSYWRDGGRLSGGTADNSLFVADGGTVWWYLPVDDRDQRISVGMVAAAPSEPAEFRAAAARAPVISHLLCDAHHTGPVRAVTAPTRLSRRLVGPGWLLVGDAAGYVDPILTPGVQLAVQFGQSAAHAVHSALDEGPLADIWLAEYERRLTRRHQTYRWLAANLFAAGIGPCRSTSLSTGGDEQAQRLQFLSVISAVPPAQLGVLLGRYLVARTAATRYGGSPPVFGEQEGFAFLSWLARRPEPAAHFSGGVVSLGRDLVVKDIVAVDGDGREPRTVRVVRSGRDERFLLTRELQALIGALTSDRDYADLARRFAVAVGSPPDPDAFRGWLDLLNRHGLVECRPAPAPAPTPIAVGAAGAKGATQRCDE